MGSSSSSKSTTIIFDTRTHEEYCAGHICHSVHIPTRLPTGHPGIDYKTYSKMCKQLKAYLQTHQPSKKARIAVYCKKGKRAGEAVHCLKGWGYDAFVLGGVEVDPLKAAMERGDYPMCQCSG